MTAASLSKRHFYAGFFALVIFGFFTHGFYQLTGNSALAACFFPVNESVWEHMKLAFMALFFWAVAETFIYGRHLPNFFLAKLVSYLIINGLVLVVFYGYHIFIDRVIVPLDIASYIIGCWLAQHISFRLYNQPQKQTAKRAAILLLVMAGIFQAVFTFSPPKKAIFKDRPSGTYGYYRKN